MFCALDPKYRRPYLESCHDRLADDGLYLSLAFTEVEKESPPPYAISKKELVAACEGLFSLVYFEGRKCDTDIIKGNALCIFKKV
jgi:hypothetical protein